MEEIKGFEILLPLLKFLSEDALNHFNEFFNEYEALCEKIAANDAATMSVLEEGGLFDVEVED